LKCVHFQKHLLKKHLHHDADSVKQKFIRSSAVVQRSVDNEDVEMRDVEMQDDDGTQSEQELSDEDFDNQDGQPSSPSSENCSYATSEELR
jgi:hypothetical protein